MKNVRNKPFLLLFQNCVISVLSELHSVYSYLTTYHRQDTSS